MRGSLSVTSPPPNASAKVLLGFRINLDDPNDDGFQFNFGLAYNILPIAYVMAGFDDGRFAVGFGVQTKYVHFAWSLNRDPLGLDYQNFIDLNFVF